jgi:4-amino-4-deoxy-L-arabinose transferase-like glycosyltransferase
VLSIHHGPARFFNPALLLILVAHLGLSFLYSVRLPILEGEDEADHYAYVRFLVNQHTLPPISTEIVQAYHPPLYYLLAAVATFWVKESDRPATNPYWGYEPYRFGVDNKNQYIHSPAESFPYSDTSLAVHLARWLSVLFGVGTVAVIYWAVSEAFPDQPNMALAATAFAAFLPAFISSTSVVSNDSLANLLGTALIYLTLRGVRRGVSWRAALALGCCGGLLLLTKLSTAFILGPALLVVAANGFPHWPRQMAFAAFGRRIGAALIPLVLLPLPWFIRNLLVYGELTNLGELNRVLDVVRTAPLSLGEFFENVQVAFYRFWIEFGIGQITAPSWMYAGLGVVVLVAIGGWLWWVIEHHGLEQRGQSSEYSRLDLQCLNVLIILAGLAVCAVVAYIFVNKHGAQTRLFAFPALAAIAPLLVGGLGQWLPTTWRPAGALGLACGLGLFAMAVLLSVLEPAFNQPLLSANEPLPMTPLQTPVRFGHAVELLGATVTPSRVPVGDEITAHLCWQTLNTPSTELSLFVHLIDPEQNKIGERQTYPGLGRLPSIFWQPMIRFCDDVNVRLTDWAQGPASLPVIVGYFDPNETLPAYTGQQELEQVVVGHVVVEPLAAPDTSTMTPTQLSLGNVIDLLGYQWLPAGGENQVYRLTLFWRARQAIPKDYVVFVHWFGANKTLISQNDAPPRAGLYPTSAWLAGETVMDERTLTPAVKVEGTTHVEVGLYLPDTGERLGGALLSLPGP